MLSRRVGQSRPVTGSVTLIVSTVNGYLHDAGGGRTGYRQLRVRRYASHRSTGLQPPGLPIEGINMCTPQATWKSRRLPS